MRPLDRICRADHVVKPANRYINPTVAIPFCYSKADIINSPVQYTESHLWSSDKPVMTSFLQALLRWDRNRRGGDLPSLFGFLNRLQTVHRESVVVGLGQTGCARCRGRRTPCPRHPSDNERDVLVYRCCLWYLRRVPVL